MNPKGRTWNENIWTATRYNENRPSWQP